jgi:NAD(P)-dependent dehydrogenase (short-subunit alcohol dehydrogenase family)
MQPGPPGQRHAFVTGASRGIGACVARRFRQAGFNVSGLARSWTGEAEDGTLRFSADVTDEAALKAAFEAAVAAQGPVAVLVNNAGGAETAPIARSDAELVRRMLALNLESVFSLVRLALPAMLQAGEGRIVNIASTAGLKGYAYASAYAAAKHGVIGLTRSLAQELARSGVTINAICPGYVDTDLMREAVANVMAKTGRAEEEARAAFASANPQGRLVTPEEVAEAALYLAGPLAGGVNGAALSVSGGETG